MKRGFGAVLLFGMVAACAQSSNTSNQTIGTAAGASLCRSGSRYLPKEGQSVLRTLGVSTMSASVLSCGYLGGQIGLALDEKDREKMNEAAQVALDTGKVQTWDSDATEASGSSEIVKTGRAAKGRANCRTVRNTLVLADGSQKQEDLTACRNANGEWEPLDG